jgi:hypothetical protein
VAQAGFTIEREASVREDGRLSLRRMEPGLTLALRGDVRATDAVDLTVIPLPNPLPPEWAAEFAPDRARAIPVTHSDGRIEAIPLQKVVFRALATDPEGGLSVYDAILNPDGTAFFVLLPPGRGAELSGGTLSIISSDGRYMLTSRGESVDLRRAHGVKLKKGRLPADFFADHPSPMPASFTAQRSTPEGRQFLEDLGTLFPEPLDVSGIRYSARPHTIEFLTRYTALNSFGDRAISCGNLQVSTADLFGLPIGAISSGIGTLIAGFSRGDCLAGHHDRNRPPAKERSTH